MNSELRSERTSRLLVAQLETVALAAHSLGTRHEEVVRLLESVTVAASHAVDLELLREDEAAAIWADAHARHPELPPALELMHAA
jgi:hypothetical protein